MELTKEEELEIKEFLAWSGYDMKIDDILDEYEKYRDGEYVSHSFKKVFTQFNILFTRD